MISVQICIDCYLKLPCGFKYSYVILIFFKLIYLVESVKVLSIHHSEFVLYPGHLFILDFDKQSLPHNTSA